MKLEINDILKDSLVSIDTPGENLMPDTMVYSCFIHLHTRIVREMQYKNNP
jgi:precorrin-2 methylase